MRRLTFLIAITLAIGCPPQPETGTASPQSQARSFTIIALPDTQNAVSYDHQKAAGYPFDAADQFLGQMRFIAQNVQSAGGDVAFVTSLGDNWNHASTAIDPGHQARGFKSIEDAELSPRPETRAIEMPTVKKGWEMIAGKVPFSVVPGNHDYDASWKAEPAGPVHFGGLDNFRQVFGAETPFFKGQSWYVASNDGGADSAQVFEAGGYRFLHLGLTFQAPNSSLKWAEEVMARYPGLPTIVTTHDCLDPRGERKPYPGIDNSLLDPEDNNSEAIWQKLLSQQDQVFLVLCGHQSGQSRRVDPNKLGHAVHQVMADYQERRQTGDGWLRLLTFDMAADTPTIHVRTYSPHYGKFCSEISEYAAWYRPHEQPSMTDAEFLAAEEFTLELTDFRQRFDGRGKVSP